ncbi:MAG: hypothetical protein KC503_16320 [Myxococcales bacterium]|nr:hypothetical protein [Myxococcales bacterium]
MKRHVSILAVVLLSCLSLLCACGVAENAPADAQHTLRSAALKRAATHLRSSPGWADATLSDQLTPIYRPDVAGVAYYEVLVNPRGYIVVSTAAHDHPIAQWSTSGASPTAQLLAKADRAGKSVARFYKLDALSYAAEDDRGELVAHVGPLPKQIDVQASPDARRDDIYRTVWKPALDGSKRVVGGELVTRVERRGEQPRVVGLERFDGARFDTVKRFTPQMKVAAPLPWRELKASYGERYAPQLAALAKRAANAWKLERRADVAPLATANADGLVSSKRMGLHPVTAWQFGHDTEGGATAQLGYDQIPPWTANNQNSCSSGCGATAWAMLLGYADHRAAQTGSMWSSHWGIYRAWGGYGADVVAPQIQDQGVNNMTMELRARLGTFCLLDQGATAQINMYKAVYYLVGRDFAGIRTNYNLFYVADGGLLQDAINIINTWRPVIIGIGSGTSLHYALAYGYSYRYWSDGSTEIAFRVNWGDGATATEVWIPASTWFVGELVP